MVVLFIALLHSLDSALLLERILRHPVQVILLEESRTPHRGRKSTVSRLFEMFLAEVRKKPEEVYPSITVKLGRQEEALRALSGFKTSSLLPVRASFQMSHLLPGCREAESG
jgi:hypothetical protein